MLSRPETPAMFLGTATVPSWLLSANEFNASQFDQSMRGPSPTTRSLSLADLRLVDNNLELEQPGPRKAMSVLDFPVAKQASSQTQSLDRRFHKQSGYSCYGTAPRSDMLMDAYYPARVIVPALSRDVYGRIIHTFYPGKPISRSKHSVGSDSDDFQKYRDIAL